MEILRASEDYLESMLMMKLKHGYIRSIDVAEHLGVTKPSVTYATRRLNDNVIAHADVQLSRREIIYFSYVSKTYSYNCYHAISFPSLSGT